MSKKDGFYTDPRVGDRLKLSLIGNVKEVSLGAVEFLSDAGQTWYFKDFDDFDVNVISHPRPFAKVGQVWRAQVSGYGFVRFLVTAARGGAPSFMSETGKDGGMGPDYFFAKYPLAELILDV